MENKKKIYAELEKHAQEQMQSRIKPIQVKKKFPTNLFLLFGLLAFLFYIWQDDSLRYDPNDPNNKKMPSFVARAIGVLARNKTMQKYVAGIEYKNNSLQSATPTSARSATQASTGTSSAQPNANPEGPGYMPTDADLREGRYVQISGRYFKFSPDHIYYINGQKVFFESHRSPAPVTSPHTSSEEPVAR